jgi:2-hydroxychromene-2-carboxylate isomerase
MISLIYLTGARHPRPGPSVKLLRRGVRRGSKLQHAKGPQADMHRHQRGDQADQAGGQRAGCQPQLDPMIDLTRTRRDIRVVFKELPILSEASMEAARAALAARPQGRYLQFHQGLMSHPLDRELTSTDIDAIARSAGIDVTRMRRAMDDPSIMAILEQNRARAIEYNINGTPGFVINGELIPGFNQPMLEARIREAARERRAAQR